MRSISDEIPPSLKDTPEQFRTLVSGSRWRGTLDGQTFACTFHQKKADRGQLAVLMDQVSVPVPYRVGANTIAFHPDKNTVQNAEAPGLKRVLTSLGSMNTWEIYGNILILRRADNRLCILEKIH